MRIPYIYGLLLVSFMAMGNPRSVDAADGGPNCDGEGKAGFSFDRLPGFREPRSHPLIGQVYDLRPSNPYLDGCPGRALGQLVQSLRSRLVGAASATETPEVIIFGEVHDNPTHHMLRAELVKSILANPGNGIAGPTPPAAVFEHIRVDQQPAVDSVMSHAEQQPPQTTASQLFDALSWATSGWPSQEMFEPLFFAVIGGRMGVLGGDERSGLVNAVAAEGLSALPSANRTMLRNDPPLSPALRDALLTELEASHCGLIPKAKFENMANAQRYRDSHLAHQLSTAAAETGAAILFAGNGHARKDRGVPSLFAANGLKGSTTSIMLVEVEDGSTDARDYVPRDPAGLPAADVIIFTPRTERVDPCLEMRKQFQKPKM